MASVPECPSAPCVHKHRDFLACLRFTARQSKTLSMAMCCETKLGQISGSAYMDTVSYHALSGLVVKFVGRLHASIVFHLGCHVTLQHDNCRRMGYCWRAMTRIFLWQLQWRWPPPWVPAVATACTTLTCLAWLQPTALLKGQSQQGTPNKPWSCCCSNAVMQW